MIKTKMQTKNEIFGKLAKGQNQLCIFVRKQQKYFHQVVNDL